MSWNPRTTSVSRGTAPYDWNSSYIGQCTWYAYYRVQEGSGLSQPPCWYSGSGSSGTGKYTDAITAFKDLKYQHTSASFQVAI